MCTSSLQERYVNFYTDFAFKRLFGTEVNKDLLISFLNSLFSGREVIRDLRYLNVEHLGLLQVDRKAVFDIYCENESGEKILVEMQKAEQNFFRDRSIYYSTFPIQEQAPKGNWNFELKRVYTIGILDFTFDDTDDGYMHHEVKLVDTKSGRVFYDKLTYIYLEMPKFTKTESELETLFDKWLYAIKNLATLMDRPAVLQEAVFTRFFEQAEIAAFNRAEILDYRESKKNFWDINSVMETAERKGREKGIAEGREEGRAEGREEGIRQVAAAMKAKGYQISEIADILGLSEEAIASL